MRLSTKILPSSSSSSALAYLVAIATAAAVTLSSSSSSFVLAAVHDANKHTPTGIAAQQHLMQQKNQFLQAMRETERLLLLQDEMEQKEYQKDRQLRLQKSIMDAAIPSSSNQIQHQQEDNRFLEQISYYGYQNNAQQNAQQQQADEYSNYGFNITKYSLKYAGCSSIATYSDDLAMNEDANTVFEIDQYVVFRFCPSKTCSASSTYGCMSDYGEYMVPIDNWLSIISEYREEEFERYCNYCQTCYGGNNGNRELEDAAAAAAANDDGAAAQGDDFVYNCSYQSQCSGYADVCYDDQNHVDLSKFFDCKQYAANDDLTLYLGPHCASDKKTILLGVYEDQYCSKYVGDKYDVGTLTGLTLSSDIFGEYYQTDCIPCQESNLKFQNVANDNVDADSVTELCENLYDYSAKCNRHVGGATSASYQSYQQQDNELAVCSFIASVVTGTYDEYGFIYVDPLSFESDNKYNQYTKIAMRKGVVMSSQILGIVFFVFALVGMAVYAALLHLRIKRRAEGLDSLREPMPVERKDSGIMLARSGTTDTYRAPSGLW